MAKVEIPVTVEVFGSMMVAGATTSWGWRKLDDKGENIAHDHSINWDVQEAIEQAARANPEVTHIMVRVRDGR
jgi:outer membrane murein-binding lipoprotein Lpp